MSVPYLLSALRSPEAAQTGANEKPHQQVKATDAVLIEFRHGNSILFLAPSLTRYGAKVAIIFYKNKGYTRILEKIST